MPNYFDQFDSSKLAASGPAAPEAAQAPAGNFFDQFDEAKPAPPEEQPGYGSLAVEAGRRGLHDVVSAGRQTGQVIAGERPTAEPEAPSSTDRYFEPMELGMPDANTGRKVLAHAVRGGIAGAPAMVGGIAGAALGAATPIPGGALAGMVTGAGVTEVATKLAPFYEEELRRFPDDPEAAWSSALKRAAVAGGVTGAAFGAFAASPFAGPVKNLLFQTFGPQPVIAGAGRAAENLVAGRPAGEGIASSMLEAIPGTIVPAAAFGGAHAAGRFAVGQRGRPAGASEASRELNAATQPGATAPATEAPSPGAREPTPVDVGGRAYVQDHETGEMRQAAPGPEDAPAVRQQADQLLQAGHLDEAAKVEQQADVLDQQQERQASAPPEIEAASRVEQQDHAVPAPAEGAVPPAQEGAPERGRTPEMPSPDLDPVPPVPVPERSGAVPPEAIPDRLPKPGEEVRLIDGGDTGFVQVRYRTSADPRPRIRVVDDEGRRIYDGVADGVMRTADERPAEQAPAPPPITAVHAETVVPDKIPERQAGEPPVAVATFRTAKGSTYVAHDDGTTSRDKAARPEHPGQNERGPQPRSQATFYVTPEDAQKLGEFQAKGASKAIGKTSGGQMAVKYLDGPSAGKFERRTAVDAQRRPAVGLIPVETWNDGRRVHFGNEIVEVSGRESDTKAPAAPEPIRNTRIDSGESIAPISPEAAPIITSEPQKVDQIRTALRERRVKPVPGLIQRMFGLSLADARRTLDFIAGRGGFIRKTGEGYRLLPQRQGPIDLVTFLADRGGVQNQRGELRDHQKFVPGAGPLVRKNGMTLEAAWERAEEAGYPVRDTNEMLDAIRDNVAGRKVYSERDASDVAGLENARHLEDERGRLEHAAHDLGIDAPEKLSHDQLREAVIERQRVHPADDQFYGAHDDPFYASEHEDLNGPLPAERYTDDFDIPFGPPERVPAAEARPAEAAGLDEGFPGDRGRQSLAEADDLQGQARDQSARAATAGRGLDLTDQGVQRVIPGAERASDATMAQRGTDAPMRPTRGQKAPGEDGGLFDSGTGKQNELFSRRPDEEGPPPDPGIDWPRVETALRKALDHWGLGRVAADLVREIRTADGRLANASYRDGLIRMAMDRPENIGWAGFHEALHGLRDLGIIRPHEWAALERRADGWREKYRIDEAYGIDTSTPEGLRLAREEAIARAAEDFHQGLFKPPAGPIRNAMKRAFDTMEALGNGLRGLGFTSADGVFRAIEQGKMREREALKGAAEAGKADQLVARGQGSAEPVHSLRREASEEGDQAKRINAAFDAFFGKMKSRHVMDAELGREVTELYSRRNDDPIESAVESLPPRELHALRGPAALKPGAGIIPSLDDLRRPPLPNERGKDLGGFGRAVGTPELISALHKGFGPVYSFLKDRMMFRETNQTDLIRTAERYFKASGEDKQAVNAFAELADRKGIDPTVTNQRALPNDIGGPNDPGGLGLSQRGQTVALTDPQWEMYRGIRKGLDQSLDLVKRSVLRFFEMDPDGPVNSVASAIAAADAISPVHIPAGFTVGTDASGLFHMKNADGDVVGPYKPTRGEAVKAYAEQEMGKFRRLAYQLQNIEDMRKTGYMPHSFFGDYMVIVRDRETGRAVATPTFETNSIFGNAAGRLLNKGEIHREVERLKTVYDPARFEVTNPIELFKDGQAAHALKIDLGALDQIASYVGADGVVYDPFRQQVVEKLQTQGFGTHFLHRKGTPGYSTDFERSLHSYFMGMSGFVAKREYATKIRDSKATLDATRGREALRKYSDAYLDYVDSGKGEAQKLREMTYLFTLGGNVSSFVRDLFQLPNITAPYMSMFVGHGTIAKEMSRAAVDTAKTMRVGKFDLEALPVDVRDAMKKLDDAGVLAAQQSPEQMAIAAGQSEWLRRMNVPMRKALQSVTGLYSAAQRVNRLTTAIMAYRMAKEPGFEATARRVLARDHGFNAQFAEGWDPVKWAAYATDATHFNQTKVNRPTIQRGAVGALATQFKGYHLNNLALLGRLATMYGPEGKAALGYSMAGYAAVAGLLGLPFAQNIKDILEAGSHLFMGHTLNLTTEANRVMDNIGLGPAVREMILNGGSRSLGVDMGQRLGNGKILDTDKNSMVDYRSVFGPAVSVFGLGLVETLHLLRSGRYEKAATFLPPPFKGIAQAAAFEREGARGLKSDQVYVPRGQFTGFDIGAQSLGFRPARVARAAERLGAEGDLKAGMRERRDEFAARIRTSFIDETNARTPQDKAAAQARRNDLFKEVAAHNATVPPEERIQMPGPAALRGMVLRAADPELARMKGTPKPLRNSVDEIRRLYPASAPVPQAGIGPISDAFQRGTDTAVQMWNNAGRK